VLLYRLALAAIFALAGALWLSGITWGLPSRRNDRYLFGQEPAWPGVKLARLAPPALSADRQTPADVDINPLVRTNRPTVLTATPAAQAEILIRYRLYSYQPDEMVTFRALFHARRTGDPKLYQYGGLFVYPVGALLQAAGLLGFVELRQDLAWYLDHPEQFGRFYIVARGYVVLWGLLGVAGMFVLARELTDRRFALLAAMLFVLMPITVTLAHEAKPHLPAAVLMVYASWAAVRSLRTSARNKWLMWGLCGASVAMVLASWPILLLIPTVEIFERASTRARARRTLLGGLVAAMVFALANPFVVIHACLHRQVLVANLANTLGMFQPGPLAAGFVRVAALIEEGASLFVLLAGLGALAAVLYRHDRQVLLTWVPAALVLIQMGLVGADKPGEFARFAMFPCAVLALTSSVGLGRLYGLGQRPPEPRRAGPARLYSAAIAGWVLLWLIPQTWRYETGFWRDARAAGSRVQAAEWLARWLADRPEAAIGVLAEPAPYNMPPIDVLHHRLVLLSASSDARSALAGPELIVTAQDNPAPALPEPWNRGYLAVYVAGRGPGSLLRPAIISWADKPIVVYARRDLLEAG